MHYPGPIRPDPSFRPPRKWWPIILTLVCAGGEIGLYRLYASRIVSANMMTLAIAIAVPVAVLVRAGHGTQALFRGFLRRRDAPPRPTGDFLDPL
jgi:hypothetical protein